MSKHKLTGIQELERRIVAKFGSVNKFMKIIGWPTNAWYKYKFLGQKPSRPRLKRLALLLDGTETSWYNFVHFFDN